MFSVFSGSSWTNCVSSKMNTFMMSYEASSVGFEFPSKYCLSYFLFFELFLSVLLLALSKLLCNYWVTKSEIINMKWYFRCLAINPCECGCFWRWSIPCWITKNVFVYSYLKRLCNAWLPWLLYSKIVSQLTFFKGLVKKFA